MSQVDGLVQRAKAAYKAGRKGEARTLLEQAVGLDESNEQAWLWMSAVAENLEEQQICLENVLTLNPNNSHARQQLDAVLRKLGQSPPASPPPSESMGGSGLSDDGWPAFSPAPPDPGVQESSVDWHSEGPAVYGSGQAVEQPTADEYDAWMSQLNLGGASSPEPQESSGSVAPFFGDDLSGLEAFSFDSDPGTDAGSADFGSGSAFDQNPFAASSAWDASEPAAGAPAGPSAWDANDPAFGAPGDTGGFGTVFGAETESAFDPVFGSEPDAASEQSFSFGDDEDDESGDFDWAGRLGASSAPPAAPASPRMSPTSPSPVSPAPARSPSAPVFAASQPTQARAEDYFRYIPPDIEPASSGLDRSGVLLLASVVGLVLLNLVSLGLLVANLLG